MNSHAIKLTGKFELPEQLEIDTNYSVLVDGEITGISKYSQEDGSYEFVYKFKPLSGEIKNKGKEVIRLADKKHQSAKLRSQLVAIAIDRGLEPEAFYDATMVKFRHYTMEILDFLNGLENI